MKTVSLQEAVGMIPDGASLMIGGFMAVGTPERLVDELVSQGKRDLTVIANDNAAPGRGIGKLITAGLVKKTIASHIGLNRRRRSGCSPGRWRSSSCRRAHWSSASGPAASGSAAS
jgi:acyl CoA:acetate/3-ketoacid CoA transferase alpha subunit